MRPLILAVLVATLMVRPAAAQQVSPPWIDLGFALGGTFGDPALVASGTLEGESALEISLTNCLPLQKAYLVIGLGTLFAPYKGGTLVPAFDLLFVYSTGTAGSVALLAHFPPGVPAGTPFVMQFWIDDPAAPFGRAGSNAVGALTP